MNDDSRYVSTRLIAFISGALFFVLAVTIVAPPIWNNALALILAYGAGYTYRSALD